MDCMTYGFCGAWYEDENGGACRSGCVETDKGPCYTKAPSITFPETAAQVCARADQARAPQSQPEVTATSIFQPPPPVTNVPVPPPPVEATPSVPPVVPPAAIEMISSIVKKFDEDIKGDKKKKKSKKTKGGRLRGRK